MSDLTEPQGTVEITYLPENPVFRPDGSYTLKRVRGLLLNLDPKFQDFVEKMKAEHPEADAVDVEITYRGTVYQYTWAEFYARLGIER